MGTPSLRQAPTSIGTLVPISLSQRPSYHGRSPSTSRSVRIIVYSCQHRPPQQQPTPVELASSSKEDPLEILTSPNSPFLNFRAFSRLPHVEWDLDSVVTFMVSYISIFHVPLGLGGLTLLARQLKVEDLPPQTKLLARSKLSEEEMKRCLQLLSLQSILSWASHGTGCLL